MLLIGRIQDFNPAFVSAKPSTVLHIAFRSIMGTTAKTLGLVLAGVLVILFYVSASVSGAIYGAASPMSFMIYVGLALTAVW